MRAGKGREQSIFREELEGADVQLVITAQRVAQAAFGFRERRRIENDQVILGAVLFRRAQKREHVLFDPLDR